MEGKSARLPVISQQSNQNTATKTQQTCHYRGTRKTGELFLFVSRSVDFSLRNNFANAGSFAGHIYNSLHLVLAGRSYLDNISFCDERKYLNVDSV